MLHTTLRKEWICRDALFYPRAVLTNVYVQGVKQASRCKAVSLSGPNGYVYGLTAMAQIFDAHAAWCVCAEFTF